MTKFNTLIIVFLLFLSTGCGLNKNAETTTPYNSNVEGFTSGKISRFSPVYLLLNQDVDSTKMTAEVLKKHLKIEPAVEGNFTFENSRTIVFRPSKSFERDKEYRIKADLSGFFEVKPDEREFTFRFSTYDLALRAYQIGRAHV